MKNILSLLDQSGTHKLITYKGRTETQDSFSALVDHFYHKLKNSSDLDTSEFVAVTNENPIEFYSLLFALWKNGNKVIFPTRDFLRNRTSFQYHQYEINCDSKSIYTAANDSSTKVDIDPRGDTVVFSSGSTGAPKGIVHNKDTFLKNALAVADIIKRKNLTNITFLKPYLVSAFSHFLVHYLTHSHLIFIDFDRVHCLGESYEDQKNMGIVGSPMHMISSHKYIPKMARPTIFFSSGDFISANTISNILDKFPDTTFFNVYGLAELAGRFFINRIDSKTPQAQFEAMGENISPTKYKIMDSQLFVHSDLNFFGSIINNNFEPSAKFHPSGDLVFSNENGMFLYGRSNDEIKILGNKVSLKYIEGRIRNVLKQDTAVLLSTPHPSFGNILSLVLNTNAKLNRTELIKLLRKDLSPHEIPHKYFYIDQLPFTETMKIDRNRIVDQLDSLEPILS